MDKLKQIFTPYFSGFFWSNLFGLSAVGFCKYLDHIDESGTIIFSAFVVVPVIMGIIAAWFWQPETESTSKLLFRVLGNTFLVICLSFMFLAEGIICLIIVSPLIFCFMAIGAVAGRAMRKKRNDKVNVSIVLTLAAVFASDALSTHYYENEVSDTIIINAPPAKVWPNVVAFPRIQAPVNFWLFRIGLPSPVESTVTGYYKGAGRKCIFSNNYVFDEVVSTCDPAKNLVFDITNQPKDPEIMNHLALERGQFLLKDNGNGTTTLTGNSWYRLYVFPAWYYDIWAKSIIRNVHTRVMRHVKELSEQQ